MKQLLSYKQFRYGEDGLDPAEMEGDSCPIKYDHTFAHVINSNPCPGDPALLPHEVVVLPSSEAPLFCSAAFLC